MKSVLRYALVYLANRLGLYVWLALLAAACLFAGQVRTDGIAAGPEFAAMLRAQAVLTLLWWFLILQVGAWAATLASRCRRGGLGAWWTARGIDSLRQAGGLWLALLTVAGGFILLGICALEAADRIGGAAMPLRLLAEQGATAFLAAALYIALLLCLGARLEQGLALAVGVAVYLFSLYGTPITHAVTTSGSGAVRLLGGNLLLLLPNLDLYCRPGALLHHWPPLSARVLAALALYAAGWVALCAASARWLLRPASC